LSYLRGNPTRKINWWHRRWPPVTLKGHNLLNRSGLYLKVTGSQQIWYHSKGRIGLSISELCCYFAPFTRYERSKSKNSFAPGGVRGSQLSKKSPALAGSSSILLPEF